MDVSKLKHVIHAYRGIYRVNNYLNYDSFSDEDVFNLSEYIDDAKCNMLISWYIFNDITLLKAWATITSYLIYYRGCRLDSCSMESALLYAQISGNNKLLNMILEKESCLLEDNFLVNQYDKNESFNLQRLACLGKWEELEEKIGELTKSYVKGKYVNVVDGSTSGIPLQLKLEFAFFSALIRHDTKEMQSVLNEIYDDFHGESNLEEEWIFNEQIFSENATRLIIIAKSHGYQLQVPEGIMPSAWLHNFDQVAMPTPWQFVTEIGSGHQIFVYKPLLPDFIGDKTLYIRNNLESIDRLNDGFEGYKESENLKSFISRLDRSPVTMSNVAASIWCADKNPTMIASIAKNIKNHWIRKKSIENICDSIKYNDTLSAIFWLTLLARDKNHLESFINFPHFLEDELSESEHSTYSHFMKNRQLPGTNPHRFWLFQLALSGKFSQLSNQAQLVMKSNVSKLAKTEARFFISLIKNDISGIENTIRSIDLLQSDWTLH
ncbi:hypothetical protein [Vibrio nigripulchritudo]|uniref:hypothetical protein n=1 Tax=Vibrio nigripulchritudo TaxID=28173 RepID=UPI0003B1EF1D|nr:hypothetical protein [Vibrio nigripulchritudo]CCN72692.1 hypothetical protein VIBNISFn118_640001 [Vibrio nigripulchritudo SFn118]